MARTEGDATLFGVSYIAVADLFSKGNSSPQTTELNAAHRAPTLMKWVNIETAESLFFIGILTAAAPKGHKQWPIMGGLTSLALTYGQYVYAKQCGMSSTEDPTEKFPPGNNQGTRPNGRMGYAPRSRA